MAKAGKGNMPEKLASDKAKLLAELKKIEELEKKFEEETRWEKEGKPYVINQLTTLFEIVTEKLEKTKERFENSTTPYDNLVAEFIGGRMKDFSRIFESALQRASKKETIEQFQKAISKTLSSTSSKGEGEEDIDSSEQAEQTETPLPIVSQPKEPKVKRQQEEAPDNLPAGYTMGIVWDLLTKYDFSKEADIKEVKQLILKKELVYGSKTVTKSYVATFAKDIFDKFSSAEILSGQSTVQLTLDTTKITVSVYSVMKSFYRFAENNVLVKPQKEMDEIKKEDFMGIKSVERFLKLLHITVKPTAKPVVPLLSQEDLHTLVNKLNNGDTGKEIVSDPALLLNFRTRQINMSEELSVIKNGSSNQIMHLLMKRFDQDLPIIAQLVEKTKIRRYDEDFLKNVTFTHKEIDRLVISNEMKAMCSQSYDVLTQFNRFVEYYCSIKNEKDLLSRFRVSCLPLHGIDITTDEGCKLFLKRVMPQVGHKKNITHVYVYFIIFLNRAKGDPIAVKSMVPSIEDVLKTTKEPIALEKAVSKTVSGSKKQHNNDSELMGERDNDTIEAYLLDKCDIKKVQDIYNEIRKARSSDIKSDSSKDRDKYLNDARLKVLDLGKNGLVPSRDKINSMVKYLFDMTLGQRNHNTIIKMIKNNPKPINFARDLRNIITK